MKKMLSFTLAVVLALSLLVGSAFASSGVGSYFTPDTFISWGDSNNPYTLSVPSVAITGRNFIVYQVRDWALSYLRVRFVIDSFDSEIVPVEGESVAGWIRYSGTWAFGVNSALSPDYYSTSLYVDETYNYSRSFLVKPVYSNFDYYDRKGRLIISGDTSGDTPGDTPGSADDSLMDLTLNDGTVIQVSRHLQGNDFVVARSSSNADHYKIWLFQPSQIEQGLVYEGSTEALYFTSDGSLASDSVVTVNGVTVDLTTSSINFESYPFVFLIQINDNNYGIGVRVFATSQAATASYSNNKWNYVCGSVSSEYYFVNSGWYGLGSYGALTMNIMPYDLARYASNYNVMTTTGDLFLSSSFDLYSVGGWSWSPWLTMSAALDITQYGDIVYQTFYYPLSSPEVDPTPTPTPSPTTTPDGSNNGLFAWLKQQWVFLMGKLDEIISAIKDLTFDLDPFPNETKPILDDFFEHIFPDRVSSDDVSGIGSVLDKMGDWFDTGYGITDLFGVFNDDGFDSWFSSETQDALDSVGSEE